jgi:hypothetical protein
MSDKTDYNAKGQEDGAKDRENIIRWHHDTPHTAIKMNMFDSEDEARQHSAENAAYEAGYKNASES